MTPRMGDLQRLYPATSGPISIDMAEYRFYNQPYLATRGEIWLNIGVDPVIGRDPQKRTLDVALSSKRPELVAVYGRRRVGKTFLIRQHLQRQLHFELTGMHGASARQQLANFAVALGKARGTGVAAPANWVQAFEALSAWLEQKPKHPGKRVLFFDELPWLASRRSGFLSAFEHFWNSWASRRSDLVVVVCGSAASWMLHHVLNQRGGLHNRVTRRLLLEPFNLYETQAFLRSRGVDLGHYQCLELYMALGGIPYYLGHAEPGQSAAQIIERTCFAKDGPLRDEFDRLFASLFENSERHIQVCRALASRRGGLTRQQLIESAKLSTGGTTSKTLDELEQSGFIMVQPQFGHERRDALFRLADEYSLFFLTWMAKRKSRSGSTWSTVRGTPAWRAWSGLTFESLCLKHVDALKHGLQIGAVHTEESAWHHRAKSGSDQGAQIDLVIDRQDASMNLCEMKFSDAEFVIDKAYAAKLRNKRATFARVTKTRKTLFLTLVTTYGVRDNDHAQSLGINSITMDALFRQT